jgi:hypothetical protein
MRHGMLRGSDYAKGASRKKYGSGIFDKAGLGQRMVHFLGAVGPGAGL